MLTCPFHSFTGFDCPFCGMQRAFVELFNGNFSQAFFLNPVVWCLTPYFLLCAICTVGQVLQSHGHQDNFFVAFTNSSYGQSTISNRTIAIVALILLLWCVIRNAFGFQAANAYIYN